MVTAMGWLEGLLTPPQHLAKPPGGWGRGNENFPLKMLSAQTSCETLCLAALHHRTVSLTLPT